jgi:hypothetical protein
MKFVQLLVVSFLLVACGSGKDSESGISQPVKIPEIDVNAFVNEVYAANGMPAVGDVFSFLVPHSTIVNKSDCLFWLFTEVKLQKIVGNELVFSVNQIFTPSKENPADCGTILSTQKEEKYSLESYLANKKRQLRYSFSAEKWCFAYDNWCQTAELVKSEDVEHKGQKARYVEYKILAKNGKNYTRRAWISKQSLMLGEFENELVNAETNAWVYFKDYVNK